MLLFKFPFQQTIFTTDEKSENSAVTFYSFDESQKVEFQGSITPVLGDLKNTKPLSTKELATFQTEKYVEEQEPDYTEKLKTVIEYIKENNLSKLVISRRKALIYSSIPEKKTIDLTASFLQLCNNYPNAFAYLFHKDDKCWMGAFSELLGKFNKKTSEFETMSLAGTLLVNEEWTSKEIEEQKPVTQYIKTILEDFSETVQVSPTTDHISGNIKHLRTDFKAQINRENLEKLIAELHPTPAVCGFPKEKCLEAIDQFEDYPRNFYSGYTRVETDEEIYYFVNLRCAEFFDNLAFFYAGGGITEKSNPKKEWQETELKTEAVYKNLVIA